MKKLLSVILAISMMLSYTALAFAEGETFDLPSYVDLENTRKREDVFVRDPCVLAYGGYYFMYGTGLASCPGYGCVVSKDLENWSNSVNVFDGSKQENFDGIADFWAPECYYYNGSFYIFATYRSGTTSHRGVSILKSDSPLGPFKEITAGHITPHEWDSIDGTLYIDQKGEPWMIFVHEWTSMPDGIGDMSYAKLSEDLTEFTTEPVTMFKANDPLWTVSFVTDGPFPYRTSDGSLVMLWSNGASSGGYSVGIARSSNGEIDGEWTHENLPLYMRGDFHDLDGGHGMIFETYDGRKMLSIHSPNSSGEIKTHAVFYEIEDTGDSVKIKGESRSFFQEIKLILIFVYKKIDKFFKNIF